jgi:hypothetical protein
MCSRCTARGAVCVYPNTLSEVAADEIPSHGFEITQERDRSSGDNAAAAHQSILNNRTSADAFAFAKYDTQSRSLATPVSVAASYTPVTPNSECSGSTRYASGSIQRRDQIQTYGASPNTNKVIDSSEESSEVITPENDIAQIRERWLYPFVDQSPARYAVMYHSMCYICRIFRTYPRMMARNNQLPPIIHPSQLTTGTIPLPLANCFTLTRMWEGGAKGTGDLVQETISREMTRLFNEVRS